jgi:hypothetical protein
MHPLDAVRLPLQFALSAFCSAAQRGALTQQQKNLLQLDDPILRRIQYRYRVKGKIRQVIVVRGVASGQDQVLKLLARAGDNVSIDFGLILSVPRPHFRMQRVKMLLYLRVIRAKNRVLFLLRIRVLYDLFCFFRKAEA